MAQTVRCPDCDRLAAIPEGAEASDCVRCPLCDAVFPLDRAHPGDEESSDLLPELVPVAEAEPSAGEPETHEPALSSQTIANADDPPAGMDLVVRCPHCHAEAKLGELVVAATGQPLDAIRLAEALGTAKSETGPSAEAAGGAWGSFDALSSFEFAPREAGNADSSAASLARRRKSSKGVLGQLLGVILGGLLALPIAYYLLNLIRGEQFDWFHVPLPFAPHTYKHLPEWWPDWARPASDDPFGAAPAERESDSAPRSARFSLQPDSRGLAKQHATAAASDLHMGDIRPPTSPGLMRHTEVCGHHLAFGFFVGAGVARDEQPVELIRVGHRV
jgi:phage FluMu protein Com